MVKHRHICHAPRAGKGMVMAPEGRRDRLPSLGTALPRKGKKEGIDHFLPSLQVGKGQHMRGLNRGSPE